MFYIRSSKTLIESYSMCQIFAKKPQEVNKAFHQIASLLDLLQCFIEILKEALWQKYLWENNNQKPDNPILNLQP